MNELRSAEELREFLIDEATELSGAERVLLTAMAGLQSEMDGARIHLITLADGPLVAEARTLGVTVQVLPVGMLATVAGLPGATVTLPV